MNGLIIDNFAGGGGASTGISNAIGRSVDIAINHDANAIAMHKTNHPDTKHHCESVFDVDPLVATNGLPVTLAWFSPDCRHYSKARGAAPVKKEISIDRDYKGNKFSKKDQNARCGNAVPPQFSEALVKANLPELCDLTKNKIVT